MHWLAVDWKEKMNKGRAAIHHGWRTEFSHGILWMGLMSLLISCTNHFRLDLGFSYESFSARSSQLHAPLPPAAIAQHPKCHVCYVQTCFVKPAEHGTSSSVDSTEVTRSFNSYSPVLTFLHISRNSDYDLISKILVLKVLGPTST